MAARNGKASDVSSSCSFPQAADAGPRHLWAGRAPSRRPPSPSGSCFCLLLLTSSRPGDAASGSIGMASSALYLLLAYPLMMLLLCISPHQAQRCPMQNYGRFFILLLTAFGALREPCRHLVRARRIPKNSPYRHRACGHHALTLSWGFVHTAFALHYAHEYYRGSKSPAGCNSRAARSMSTPIILGLCAWLSSPVIGTIRVSPRCRRYHRQRSSAVPRPCTASSRSCSTRRCWR